MRLGETVLRYRTRVGCSDQCDKCDNSNFSYTFVFRHSISRGKRQMPKSNDKWQRRDVALKPNAKLPDDSTAISNVAQILHSKTSHRNPRIYKASSGTEFDRSIIASDGNLSGDAFSLRNRRVSRTGISARARAYDCRCSKIKSLSGNANQSADPADRGCCDAFSQRSVAVCADNADNTLAGCRETMQNG